MIFNRYPCAQEREESRDDSVEEVREKRECKEQVYMR